MSSATPCSAGARHIGREIQLPHTPGRDRAGRGAEKPPEPRRRGQGRSRPGSDRDGQPPPAGSRCRPLITAQSQRVGPPGGSWPGWEPSPWPLSPGGRPRSLPSVSAEGFSRSAGVRAGEGSPPAGGMLCPLTNRACGFCPFCFPFKGYRLILCISSFRDSDKRSNLTHLPPPKQPVCK